MKLGIARLTLTACLVAWALLGLITPVAAQDVDKDDVEDLASNITEQDPRAVAEALQSEFNADNLPDGFTEAVFSGGDGTPAAGETTGAPSPGEILGTGDFEGAVAVIPFSVTPEEPADDDGDEAPAEGTLPVDLPAELQNFGFYAIYFIVFEDADAASAALDEALSDDDEIAEEGFEVEEHEDFGVPGAAISGAQSEEGANTALAMNAVQVGNVAVMGLAATFEMSDEAPDLDAIKETAKNLVAAGILHLEESVEDL